MSPGASCFFCVRGGAYGGATAPDLQAGRRACPHEVPQHARRFLPAQGRQHGPGFHRARSSPYMIVPHLPYPLHSAPPASPASRTVLRRAVRHPHAPPIRDRRPGTERFPRPHERHRGDGIGKNAACAAKVRGKNERGGGSQPVASRSVCRRASAPGSKITPPGCPG